MNGFSNYISSLINAASLANQRGAIVLHGSKDWTGYCINKIQTYFDPDKSVWLGESDFCLTGQVIPYHQGRRFLGNELELIIVDLSCGFDANSFSAICGALRGGGLLCLLNVSQLEESFAGRWLERSLSSLTTVKEGDDFSQLPIPGTFSDSADSIQLRQQQEAIERIGKVLSGHRKRPLIISADRGRGKTSALGLAAAHLMQVKPGIHILICAPNLRAVESAFFHAQCALDNGHQAVNGQLSYYDSTLSFIAPDALLAQTPQCDLLLVDEAAAIPLPMLQDMVSSYHRVVFSSTLHGYEGCGLGFTLKFIRWLESARPGFSQYHLSQPIRWAENDYLELWLNHTFLINSPVAPIAGYTDIRHEGLRYRSVSKEELFRTPMLFNEVFSVLVNAHYQTTPNDMMLILSDESISVHIAAFDNRVVACVLICREGRFSDELIKAVSLGLRRPCGHLVPVTLVNQLGFSEHAKLCCDRIMRIATHPHLHRRGIGRELLKHVVASSKSDYLATSFGLTEELFEFWKNSGFIPVKLGSHKDHVSGTYSILMCHNQNQDWIQQLHARFCYVFSSSLVSVFNRLEPALARLLLVPYIDSVNEVSIPVELIHSYSSGGSNYESVEVWIRKLIEQYSMSDYISDLMILKILQNYSWTECSVRLGYKGKKQTEGQLRQDIKRWLVNLHCKEYSQCN